MNNFIQLEIIVFQVCCSNEIAQSAQPPISNPRPAPGQGLTPNDMPQPGVCGNHLADRIVGGEVAAIDEYPWMVLIEYTKRKKMSI